MADFLACQPAEIGRCLLASHLSPLGQVRGAAEGAQIVVNYPVDERQEGVAVVVLDLEDPLSCPGELRPVTVSRLTCLAGLFSGQKRRDGTTNPTAVSLD